MAIIYEKLNDPREHSVANINFHIEDDLLCEEILENYQCDAIIGMINENLPEGCFITDAPQSWEYVKNMIEFI